MTATRIKQVRWVVMGVVAACLIGFIGALLLFPDYARQLPPTVLPNGSWTTEAAQAALRSLGWTAHTYMLWRMGLVLVTAVFYCGLGLFVLLRRPADPFALLLALSMVLFGTAATDAPYVLAQWGPVGERLAYGLTTLAYGLLIFLTILFPDGRFVPRWTRWMGVAGGVLMVYAVFGVPHPTRPPAAPIVAMISLLFLASAAGQVYRYRVVGTAVQRQQTKWVLGTILLNLAFQLGLNIIYASPVVNALDGQGHAVFAAAHHHAHPGDGYGAPGAHPGHFALPLVGHRRHPAQNAGVRGAFRPAGAGVFWRRHLAAKHL